MQIVLNTRGQYSLHVSGIFIVTIKWGRGQADNRICWKVSSQNGHVITDICTDTQSFEWVLKSLRTLLIKYVLLSLEVMTFFVCIWQKEWTRDKK